MNSMFDSYFGGSINSRAKMQEKIKSLKTSGNVITELDDLLAKLPEPGKYQLFSRKRGTPFVGDAFIFSY